jgi:histidyl-tRNA synthetase
MADTVWKRKRDVRVWYQTICWRYEKPSAGRYREFTQFGVEVLNPRKRDLVERADLRDSLIELAEKMVKKFTDAYEVSTAVKRGLAYYVEDGFEISCPKLGAQKQVCGGGSYEQGCGFAFGVDRLMLV